MHIEVRYINFVVCYSSSAYLRETENEFDMLEYLSLSEMAKFG